MSIQYHEVLQATAPGLIFAVMFWMRYLFGPELIWVISCLAGRVLVRLQRAEPGRYDGWIESSTFWPTLVLLMTLALYLVPGVPRQLLFLRITLTALLGAHFLLNPILESHSKGGPGIGTIYIVAYIVLFVALLIAFILKLILIK